MAKKETKAKSEDPEAVERRRLKRMAVSKGIISEAPLKESSTTLTPSKTVVKHHGKDIVKKSQRKNRFLFSFPGLLAPIGGGKIGELKDLGTKNPILYLHFPQGVMKLFGTIMYPKNRYLTLQFSRGGKNVMCEDSFDTMIVFSDAWWIGNKEENPEEARLEFPKELAGEHPSECDFRGGAGSTTENKSNVNNSVQKFVKEQTPETDVDDESSKSENNATELPKQTPTRHSARTSGKSYKFAEAFSSDDEIDADISKISEEKSEEKESNMIITPTSNAKVTLIKAPKVSKSSSKATSSISRGSGGSLVQPTISTLFKKAEEKKEPTNSKNITPLTAVDPKPQSAKSARRIDLDETSETRKKRKLVKGSDSKTTKKNPEDEDDVIEELSSSSQDTYGSDQDWAGDL